MAIGETAKSEGGRTLRGSFSTLREAADRVKVHPSTILRWLKNKKVAVTKYRNASGHWVFRDEDVQKFEEYKKAVTPID